MSLQSCSLFKEQDAAAADAALSKHAAGAGVHISAAAAATTPALRPAAAAAADYGQLQQQITADIGAVHSAASHVNCGVIAAATITPRSDCGVIAAAALAAGTCNRYNLVITCVVTI